LLRQIPYSSEQGIYAGEQGNVFPEEESWNDQQRFGKGWKNEPDPITVR
jgi:hypothetical protein